MAAIGTSPTAEPFAIPASPTWRPPPLNPVLSELDPGARADYFNLLLFLGDSELVIGHRHSEWTGFAPSAEEDVAFSSIAQDEMGHAHLYYALLTGADDEEAVDRLALDRGPSHFRHLRVLHAANGDWYFTSARMIFWDVFEDVFLRAALESRLPLLGSAAQRILNEDSYHLEHADQWLNLLSSRAPQRARLAKEMARVARMAGNPVLAAGGHRELGDAGLIRDQARLAVVFRAALLDRLRGAGWDDAMVSEVDAALSAPVTRSIPGLRQLHRDLTGLRRAHPGTTW